MAIRTVKLEERLVVNIDISISEISPPAIIARMSSGDGIVFEGKRSIVARVAPSLLALQLTRFSPRAICIINVWGMPIYCHLLYFKIRWLCATV
jgi:hypothetical protein